ncbi:MAG TPA: hypothetical protein VFU09_04740 [Candidatus Udaeobacter sp.]|nr:hypothetical protein [Candidatus Udaeobacter sp.]
MRQRIIIHAGFAKCGSASIRTALFQNFRELHKHGVFVFDKDLRIARTAADLVGTPIWSLEEARKRSENLTQRLADEIASVIKRKTYHLAILSAENLANPGMNELFAGLDSQFEVSVIFYLRPQLQWIPSAWKQWGLKEGVPLSDFVSQCIDAYMPSFKLAIDAWKSALPTGKVDVRFLIPELLQQGNPVQDFFDLIGLAKEAYDVENEPRNPSLDVSILHVLSKNPHLFSGVHDNSLPLGLTRALSKKFRSKNIQMLSPEQEAAIEKCFRDENLWLLKTYCRDVDVDRIYQTHFTPQEAETRYSSMTDIDLIYRCLGIILESIAFSGDQYTTDENKLARQSYSL